MALDKRQAGQIAIVVHESGHANGEVSRSIRLNFSQRFPSSMPVLCPTLPTGPLRMQTEQNVEDLCNSLRLKDISSFQGVVWFARVIGILTLDLAILVRVQASQPNFLLSRE